jgi:FSR family fosmidomycin resistance protein-like MFS transporter
LNPASNPWRDDAAVIGLVGVAHASSHFSHLLLPLMFPVFISTFGLSYSELGFLMTVFFVVSGLGQASAGFVVDRFGARPVLFAALLLLAAGCMAVSVADSYVGLVPRCLDWVTARSTPWTSPSSIKKSPRLVWAMPSAHMVSRAT